TFSVKQSEFFGLVGVNGAGKSTLIKSFLDFNVVDSGSIKIFGVPHMQVKARERLSFLPEHFIPPYYLSGKDFLDYMSRLHGITYESGEIEELMLILDFPIDALNKF